MQGGVGAFSQIMARTLTEQGHQVSVLSSAAAQESDPRIFMTTVTKWNYPALRVVKQWAEEQQLDVVNVQFETAAYQMSPFVHFLPDVLRPIPTVTTFHDLLVPYLFPKAGKLREWIVMRLARASAGVIATNHEDYARVKQLPHTAMIPIGSNILTTPDTAPRSISDRMLVFFGFMNRSKGVDTLLHALAKLRAMNHDFELVMVGDRVGTSDPTNAAYAREIDQLIARLRLQDVVRWTGFIDQVQVGRYLREAHAVVLPFTDGASFRRGTLMAAIEHESAIVTTQPQVSIPEFIDGDNMRLVPAGDSDALADKILTLDGSRLRAGVKQLKACFDWNLIARDTAVFFEKVIDA